MTHKMKSSKAKASQPSYENMIQVRIVMSHIQGVVHLCVVFYRREPSLNFPAILAFAVHNKDLQTPNIAEAIPPQPAWSPLWQGGMEAGGTKELVSTGHVHVVGHP